MRKKSRMEIISFNKEVYLKSIEIRNNFGIYGYRNAVLSFFEEKYGKDCGLTLIKIHCIYGYYSKKNKANVKASKSTKPLVNEIKKDPFLKEIKVVETNINSLNSYQFNISLEDIKGETMFEKLDYIKELEIKEVALLNHLFSEENVELMERVDDFDSNQYEEIKYNLLTKNKNIIKDIKNNFKGLTNLVIKENK